MRIAPISCLNNNSHNRNSVSFRGEPSRSFYKYLEIACKESENPEAKKIAEEIADAVRKFMKPLHKDTTLSIYNKKAVKNTMVPFPTPHSEAELVNSGNYQSMFSNKKTGTEFAMHEVTYINYGGDKYEPASEGRLLLPDKLESLKKHIDNIIEFFDKDKKFNVDTVLYNLMFEKRDLKYANSLIPFKPLRRLIYNRDTQKAEKLASEFNIDDKSKPLKVFINPFA